MLDLGLPDMDGIDLCRRIRSWSDVPVVVLSADGTEDRKVDALGAGADDYMTKPFGMRELNARLQLQVALRHRAPAEEQVTELDVGPLHLDLVHYEAIMNGRSLDLAAKEFEFPCLPRAERRQVIRVRHLTFGPFGASAWRGRELMMTQGQAAMVARE